jgi:hypothetical protein
VTTYTEWTTQVGDAWVAALKRAEDAIESVSASVRESAATMQLPQFQVPEQMSTMTNPLSEKLPKPSEIVEANFELTNRVLTAQRELTIKLLEASAPAAAKS